MKRKLTSDDENSLDSSFAQEKSKMLNLSQDQGDSKISTTEPTTEPTDSSTCLSSILSPDLRNDNLISLNTKFLSAKKPKIKDESAFIDNINKKRIVVIPIPSNAKRGDIIYISDKQFSDAKKQIAFKLPSKHYYMSEGKDKKSIHYIKVVLPTLNSKLSIEKEASTENRLQCQSSPIKNHPSPDSRPPNSKEDKTQNGSPKPSPAKSPSKITPRRGERIRRTPQDGEGKRYELGFRSKIGIGPLYQVDPMQIPNPCNVCPSPPLAELCEQIWDPNVSCKVSQTKLDTTNYILRNLPSNQKQIMMEELHKCNYDVPSAMLAFGQKLSDLKARGELPGEKLPKEIEALFFKAIWESRKNIVAAIKTVQKQIKISTCSLLVHYYNHYKPSEEYSKLKEIRHGESDYCLVCDDGGVLICCDECSGTYHLDCLDPPLKSIPEDKWYCPKCVQASVAKKMRGETRKLGPAKTVSRIVSAKKKFKSAKSNVDPTWSYWGLNQM